jgi:hypothetical protein
MALGSFLIGWVCNGRNTGDLLYLNKIVLFINTKSMKKITLRTLLLFFERVLLHDPLNLPIWMTDS